jgi:hypothetical protein
MCDCPTIKPLALSVDLDFENLDDFDNSIDDYEATSSAPASTSMDSSTATISV